LPPLPQSYDELYIHPKTAAGVVGERQKKSKQDVYNVLCVYHMHKHTRRFTSVFSVHRACPKCCHNLCVGKHIECEICVTHSSIYPSFSFGLQWLRGHKWRWDGKAGRNFFRFLCVINHTLACSLPLTLRRRWRDDMHSMYFCSRSCTTAVTTCRDPETPLIRKNICSQGGENEGEWTESKSPTS
jgi:hypothetical protein